MKTKILCLFSLCLILISCAVPVSQTIKTYPQDPEKLFDVMVQTLIEYKCIIKNMNKPLFIYADMIETGEKWLGIAQNVDPSYPIQISASISSQGSISLTLTYNDPRRDPLMSDWAKNFVTKIKSKILKKFEENLNK